MQGGGHLAHWIAGQSCDHSLQPIRVSGNNSILPVLFTIFFLMNTSCRKNYCSLNMSGDSAWLPQCTVSVRPGRTVPLAVSCCTLPKRLGSSGAPPRPKRHSVTATSAAGSHAQLLLSHPQQWHMSYNEQQHSAGMIPARVSAFVQAFLYHTDLSFPVQENGHFNLPFQHCHALPKSNTDHLTGTGAALNSAAGKA